MAQSYLASTHVFIASNFETTDTLALVFFYNADKMRGTEKEPTGSRIKSNLGITEQLNGLLTVLYRDIFELCAVISSSSCSAVRQEKTYINTGCPNSLQCLIIYIIL